MNPGILFTLLIAIVVLGSVYIDNNKVKKPTGQKVTDNLIQNQDNYHNYVPEPTRDDSGSDTVRPPVNKQKNNPPAFSNGHSSTDRGKGYNHMDEMDHKSRDDEILDGVVTPTGDENDDVKRLPIEEEEVENEVTSAENHDNNLPNDDRDPLEEKSRNDRDKPQGKQGSSAANISEKTEKGEFCGIPDKKNNLFSKTRLIDGGEVAEHSWPWVALLKIGKTGHKRECIANLIQVKGNKNRTDMLVTSAKCITDWNPDKDNPPGPTVEKAAEELQVIPGIHNTADSVEPVQVVEVRKHKHYEMPYFVDNHLYDVGLVRVHPPIEFDDAKRPICFPQRTDPLPVGRNWKCGIAGFEKADDWDSPNRPRVLKQLAMAVQSSKSCRLPGKWYARFNETLTMCANILPNGWFGSSIFSTATGGIGYNDNGSPLHCFDKKTGKWRLYGTVTTTIREKGPPYIFTRFSEFAEWVSENADKMSKL